jgi:hypothetical protein
MPATTPEESHRLFAFLSNTWSLTGAGPDGKPLTVGARHGAT